ncbi:hypothetical protein CDL12_25451 [Handroanthus impetiginosus]|uniref:Uncharacterized protein n=1 Tax=Handroanthus impetiginosus TaxID=429701 RepID=A0A2G9G9S2_9LAMI|nr:hypothetical protein CDL12_25451 [Handroanthus impetiginosus]
MKDKSPTVTITSTSQEIDLYERWELSNHLSVMFIKTKIYAGICGSLTCNVTRQVVTIIMSWKRLQRFGTKFVDERKEDPRNQNSEKSLGRKGKIHAQIDIKKEPKRHLCKKKEHTKKDYVKFHKWLENKGNLISCGCMNLICFTTHVPNTLQGMRNLRKPVGSEQSIYSGNKMRSHVELIRTCTLVLSSGFVLKTFYIPSFSKNFILVSRLVPLVFQFKFCRTSFKLIYDSNVVGVGTLSDSLFSIDMQNATTYTNMHVRTSIKRYVINEDSSMLWH